MGNSATKLPPLQTVPNCVTSEVMGRPWYVIGVKPTPLEVKCSNSVERYTRVQGKSHDIDIDFHYNDGEPITSKIKSAPQKGYLLGDKENTGKWKVSPIWPLKLSYDIIEVDDKDYSYMVVGYPTRSFCWIMSRTPEMSNDLYDSLLQKLKDKHQYDLQGIRKVPQKWTKAEREKRGLSQEDLPDKYLVD